VTNDGEKDMHWQRKNKCVIKGEDYHALYASGTAQTRTFNVPVKQETVAC
jgi:hypothetical protein